MRQSWDDPMNPVNPRRWSRWGLLVVAAILSGCLLVWAHGVLMPFMLAFVIAYLLAPIVDFASQRAHIPSVLAIFLVYGVFAWLVVLALVYMVPILIQESVRIIRYVPQLSQGLQTTWNYWLGRFHQQPMPAAIRTAINATALHLQTQLLRALKGLVGAIFGLVPGVLSFLIAPILAFYVLKDLSRVRQHFWNFVPLVWRPGIFKLGLDLDRVLNGYIRGQLLVALAVGVLSALWMVALNIPFALLIGALAAVTDVVPYVGPIAGAIPAVLLGLTRSPWIAFYAGVGFLVIHQLEGTVIGPKVVGDSVGLHPLVIIFSILAGGEMAGFVGLLLAVPAAAILKVLLTHLYRRLSLSLDRDSLPWVQ